MRIRVTVLIVCETDGARVGDAGDSAITAKCRAATCGGVGVLQHAVQESLCYRRIHTAPWRARKGRGGGAVEGVGGAQGVERRRRRDDSSHREDRKSSGGPSLILLLQSGGGGRRDRLLPDCSLEELVEALGTRSLCADVCFFSASPVGLLTFSLGLPRGGGGGVMWLQSMGRWGQVQHPRRTSGSPRPLLGRMNSAQAKGCATRGWRC